MEITLGIYSSYFSLDYRISIISFVFVFALSSYFHMYSFLVVTVYSALLMDAFDYSTGITLVYIGCETCPFNKDDIRSLLVFGCKSLRGITQVYHNY